MIAEYHGGKYLIVLSQPCLLLRLIQNAIQCCIYLHQKHFTFIIFVGSKVVLSERILSRRETDCLLAFN